MRHDLSRSRGAVLIQTALLLFVLIGFVALTTDYGLMVVRQRRLQNATDAAALAAGPALRPEMSNQTAIDLAVAFRGYNNADGPTPTIVTDSNGKTLTVRATENVSTPFAGVLNSAWANRDVHATSVVRGRLGMEDGWWRPLSLMTGPGGIPNIQNKWLNQPCNLTLQYGSENQRYPDAQNVPDGVLWLFPVDLHSLGYPAATPDYIKMLEGFGTGPLQPPNPKKPGWYPELEFYPGNPGKNNTISKQNLYAWWDATWTAIMDPANKDSLVSRTGVGTKWEHDTFSHFQIDNPRFAVFLESNRSVGSETTKPGGYAGFYIESMSIVNKGDPLTETAYITGEFILPVLRAELTPSSAPSTWENYGIFTYWMVD